MHNRLFEEIDRLNDCYLNMWEDVGNLESPTNDKAGVDAVGRYFAEKAREKGWTVEIYPQPVSGDVVVITLNPEAPGAPLALSGHIDTVHPVGLFGSPAVKRDETKIYGPGVNDCKGGVVAGFMAMDALEKCGFNSRPVMLLLQTDEEVGSKYSNTAPIRYICEKALGSVAFLNLEGHNAGKAVLARKGILRYEFTVNGAAGHSSKCCTEGASAILEAAHKIIKLETLKNPEGLTCNCGTISGGTAANSVPAKCTFVADIRFSLPEEQEWVKNFVEEVAETTHVPGCSCEVKQLSFRPSMPLTEKNLALLDTVNGILEQTGLPTLRHTKSAGGSDAAYVTEYGIPCIDSIGVEGGNIHSKNEYSLLNSLAESAKRLAAVAWYI